MTRVTLPDGAPVALLPERLRPLLANALRAAQRQFKNLEPVTEQRGVYRSDPESFSFERVVAPRYRATPGISDASSALASSETAALMEYLWACKAMRVAIERDEGTPTRQDWAAYAWFHVVQEPLVRVLGVYAMEEIVRRGAFEPWELPDERIEAVAADLTDQLCNGRCTVSALSPTFDIVPESGPFDLEPDVSLDLWTSDSRALFLTQHGGQLVEDDPRKWGSSGRILIRARTSATDNANALESIATILDRLKWAIMLATGSTKPFNEGPVLITTPSGGAFPTLRRTAAPASGVIHAIQTFTSANATTASGLLGRLAAASKLSKDFEAAIWAFGRACNAQLPRDVLLESAIGLEGLLLPREAGESTYKFALHGAAVIESTNPEMIHKELKDLYKGRSKAAHGARGERLVVNAERARVLLAEAILSVVALIESGEIVIRSGDIGDAVTDFVRTRATRR